MGCRLSGVGTRTPCGPPRARASTVPGSTRRSPPPVWPSTARTDGARSSSARFEWCGGPPRPLRRCSTSGCSPVTTGPRPWPPPRLGAAGPNRTCCHFHGHPRPGRNGEGRRLAVSRRPDQRAATREAPTRLHRQLIDNRLLKFLAGLPPMLAQLRTHPANLFGGPGVPFGPRGAKDLLEHLDLRASCVMNPTRSDHPDLRRGFSEPVSQLIELILEAFNSSRDGSTLGSKPRNIGRIRQPSFGCFKLPFGGSEPLCEVLVPDQRLQHLVGSQVCVPSGLKEVRVGVPPRPNPSPAVFPPSPPAGDQAAEQSGHQGTADRRASADQHPRCRRRQPHVAPPLAVP